MKTSRKILRHRLAKPGAILLAALPALWLAARFPDGLGVNPVETLNRTTGDWALRFILLTLAVSPLARLTRLSDLLRFRRIVGLTAFSYAVLHLTSYVAIDHFFAWGEIWGDILKRNFITVGMVALALLMPLAVTSTNAMIRRLGGRNWQALHRLIYPIAMLAVLHFFMMVKADTTEPTIYAAILAVLLGYRMLKRVRIRQTRTPAPSTPS